MGAMTPSPSRFADKTAETFGASSKSLMMDRQILQKTLMKNGADFDLSGTWNLSRAAEVSRAINMHINNPGVQTMLGTYRGIDVIHYLNPANGLNVISSLTGRFVSGWKLSAEQLSSVMSTGRLF